MMKSFGETLRDIGRALGFSDRASVVERDAAIASNRERFGSQAPNVSLRPRERPTVSMLGGGGGGGGGGSQGAQKPKPVTGPYDPADVASYLERRKEQLAGIDTGINLDETPEQFISAAEEKGTRRLSQYMSADEIAGLSSRQKLAAAELFTSKGSAGNFLSDEDLAFIREGGGTGSVFSPNRSVMKTGGKESLSRYKDSTGGGLARAVELGRISKEDLTPEQLKLYEAGAKRRAAAKASGQTEEVLRGPEAAAMESAKQGRKATILTSGQGLLADEADELRRRRSLTGGGLIQ
jgi:hypothetical protein